MWPFVYFLKQFVLHIQFELLCIQFEYTQMILSLLSTYTSRVDDPILFVPGGTGSLHVTLILSCSYTCSTVPIAITLKWHLHVVRTKHGFRFGENFTRHDDYVKIIEMRDLKFILRAVLSLCFLSSANDSVAINAVSWKGLACISYLNTRSFQQRMFMTKYKWEVGGT